MTALDILAEHLTDEVKALAMSRILHGGNLATRSDLNKRMAKLALILVRILNPREDFKESEESILAGI